MITEAMQVEKAYGCQGERDCIKAEELQTAIGREAAFFIHKNVPLFSAYFLPEGLTPDESRADTFCPFRPIGWRVPRSLSKGDRAYFYCGGRLVTSALTALADLGKTVASRWWSATSRRRSCRLWPSGGKSWSSSTTEKKEEHMKISSVSLAVTAR